MTLPANDLKWLRSKQPEKHCLVDSNLIYRKFWPLPYSTGGTCCGTVGSNLTIMAIPRFTKMWVVNVDENGNEKDGRWVDVPKPDSFASDGFAHVERYVSRLLQSSARFTSVIIATPDQQMAIGLWQRGGVAEFTLSVEWRSEPERERAVRQFFSERGLSASHDYLAGNGEVPDATRCLGFFLPSDVQFITTLTKDVLCRIYQLREQDAFDFSFKKHHGDV